MVPVWADLLLTGVRKHRLRFLVERGLFLQTIRRYRLGHTGESFAIPLVDERGKVWGVKKRVDPEYRVDPLGPKYVQLSDPKTGIYRPNPGGSPTVICEGELDAVLLAQYDVDALTATGGAGSQTRVFSDYPLRGRTYIATDLDDEGEDAARKLLHIYPTALRMRWSRGKADGTLANDVTEALLGVDDPIKEIQRWMRDAQ
jgi:hypothetical protein